MINVATARPDGDTVTLEFHDQDDENPSVTVTLTVEAARQLAPDILRALTGITQSPEPEQ